MTTDETQLQYVTSLKSNKYFVLFFILYRHKQIYFVPTYSLWHPFCFTSRTLKWIHYFFSKLSAKKNTMTASKRFCACVIYYILLHEVGTMNIYHRERRFFVVNFFWHLSTSFFHHPMNLVIKSKFIDS